MNHSRMLLDASTPLRDLIRLARPVCRQGEDLLPPKGPGRPFEIAQADLAVLILIALAKRLHSKSAQYRFLERHATMLVPRLGLTRFPTRSTYFRRYRTASVVLQMALIAHTTYRIQRGHINVRCVAADKSLIAAPGRVWHKAQRQRGERPKAVDVDATWGYSPHDGWVYGYGLEVVVTAPRQGLIWPLFGSLDPAHVHETTTFPAKIAGLPSQARYVLVDSGYDSNELAEAVEYDEAGRRTGRRWVGAQQVRHNARRPGKRAWRETRRRRERRERREERRRFVESRWGRRLYKRRGKTVEPFFGRFKELFGFQEHVWHQGWANNQTLLLGSLLLYQLLLAYNRIRGHNNAEVKWILDAL